ncbi:MAG: cryptochrome/photolyase family protein [Methanomicrobiales archaeon]
MSVNESSATLIFPNQLFKSHPGFYKTNNVFLIEEQLFFGDYKYYIKFHKKKLVLHRASMRAFFDYLESENFQVEYIEHAKDSKMKYLFDKLKEKSIKRIYYADLVDYALEHRIKKIAKSHQIEIVEMDSPGFLNSKISILEYFKDKKRYFMTSFYIKQRKKRDILVEDSKPMGGKWSFDPANRKKLPKGIKIPLIKKIPENKYINEAQKYVEKNFPDNPGNVKFFYPVTHDETVFWFDDFLKNRFHNFGDYEDAISEDEPFLFHSIISPLLNIGLITPQEIIEKILKTHHINLNSKEGYIRQIIGWREFMRAIYLLEGPRQRTTNYLNHERAINSNLYWGKTGLHPYDKVVQRVIKLGYAHHIERLMILGNLMLLMDILPDHVYKWFMEMFIDSYDWVMVPNVYGMSQYSDGGLITTKPYFSSSNYIKKMSNFKHGDWEEVWDGLFWRFVYKNQEILKNNPRLRVILKGLEKKEKIEHHLQVASDFLEKF